MLQNSTKKMKKIKVGPMFWDTLYLYYIGGIIVGILYLLYCTVRRYKVFIVHWH